MDAAGARALVIDTDGGVDDAVALWWALSDPRVELAAVLVTWGNVPRDVAATNVCRILHAAGRPDLPVALGAAGPTGPTPFPAVGTYVHGDDGLGGHGRRWPAGDVRPVAEPARDLLARLTAERPGELDLVTIGPLSTLAEALAADAGLIERLRALTTMGGAVQHPGNALPQGESNVAHDPGAAATVVAAPWPRPPLLVGLDVTLRALLHADDLDLAARSGTVPGSFLADPLRSYAAACQRAGQVPEGTSPCHDLLAVLAAVEPEVVTAAPTLPLAVDTGGSAAWGATVADLRAVPRYTPPGFAPWRVALQADVERPRRAFRSLVS